MDPATYQADAFTLEQRTEMSQMFSAGNYANAYDSTDLDDHDLTALKPHERAAWVLGFFGTYELHEMGGDERELFDECYWSAAGQYVVKVAGYTDSRDEEYAAEGASMQPKITGASPGHGPDSGRLPA